MASWNTASLPRYCILYVFKWYSTPPQLGSTLLCQFITCYWWDFHSGLECVTYQFIFAHFKSFICCFVVYFYFFLITPEYEPIPLIQEYKSGYSSKRIEGCIAKTMRLFNVFPFYNWSTVIMYILILYSQVIPFCLHQVMTMGLVVLLNKNIRSLTVLTNNVSINRVSYVKLMKINIGLGVSSIL